MSFVADFFTSVGQMFGAPRTPSPQAPPPPPATPNKEGELEEAARAEKKKKGRQATILTSSRGDTSQAPVQRKTLLGQ